MDLTVVIPTLNEGAYIGKTIAGIYERKSGQLNIEIIVVDAGSNDDTAELVRDKVDKLHVDDDLRGLKYKSLNVGGNLASGKYLLFLDADSKVPINFDWHIKNALEKQKADGGAFEFEMDGKGRIYRMIEWINRLRYRIDRMYFGDQGVFCTKAIFEDLSGYPEQPIMEAAYFCRMIKKTGKLMLLKPRLVTSARRFAQGGVITTLMLDAWIWILFTLRLPIRSYAPGYWRENENNF